MKAFSCSCLVHILIPVHNRKSVTLTALHWLHTNLRSDSSSKQRLCESDMQLHYQIVVVDDGSTDGTSDAIAAAYPDVRVLWGNGELWWTGAMAMAMVDAQQQGADYLIWLNDDCLPEPGTLPNLIHFLQHHPRSIVAPVCGRFVEGESGFQPVPNGARGNRSCTAQPNDVLAVDSLSGWCVAMPIAVMQHIGLPDARKYPHYAGDDMYIRCATQRGFSAYLLGAGRAILTGAIHEGLGIQRYVHSQQRGLHSLHALLISKKSPYRLFTRYFYFTERYGFAIGIILLWLKLAQWLTQWIGYSILLLLRIEIGG